MDGLGTARTRGKRLRIVASGQLVAGLKGLQQRHTKGCKLLRWSPATATIVGKTLREKAPK
eukprot:5502436-Amphidinium_carterae.1